MCVQNRHFEPYSVAIIYLWNNDMPVLAMQAYVCMHMGGGGVGWAHLCSIAVVPTVLCPLSFTPNHIARQ